MSNANDGTRLALIGFGAGVGVVLIGMLAEMIARTGSVSVGALVDLHLGGALPWLLDALPLLLGVVGWRIGSMQEETQAARAQLMAQEIKGEGADWTIETPDPFEHLIDGVLMLLEDGETVIQMNRAARRLFGLDAPIDLDKLLPELGEGQARVTSRGESLGHEWVTEGIHADGQRFATEVAALVHRDRVIGYQVREPRRPSVLAEDFSDDPLSDVKKRLEMRAQMRDTVTSLRNERDAAKEGARRQGEFLARISHDLRVPMTTIVGYAELVEEEAAEAGLDHIRSELQHIRTTSAEVIALLEAMVDQSRIQSGQLSLFMAPIQAQELADEVAAVVEPLVAKNRNTLEVHVDPDAGFIHGDRRRVRQILLTLLGRACSRTSDGKVELRVEPRKRDGLNHIALQVRDNGEPIAADELRQLLEPLRTSADPRNRRELAFAVVAELARLMRGELTHDSETKGTDFTVFLPASDADRQRDEVVAKPSPVGQGVQRVLVAADTAASIDLLDAWLSVEGYEVAIAGSVSEAMELARDIQPEAVIIDARLEGGQGWAAVAAIKSSPGTMRIPTLVFHMTGQRAYELRALDFMLAPVRRDRLAFLARAAVREPGTALLVDNDDASGRAISGELEDRGWQVTVVSDADEAMEIAVGTVPDLVVCNLNLGEQVGLEVAIRLRDSKDLPRIPVLAVLSAPTEDDCWALTHRFTAAKGRSLDRALRNVRHWIDRVVHMQTGGEPDAFEETEDTGAHELNPP